MMLRYNSKMKGFHFVQWQNLAMPKGTGDIGLKFGGNDNGLYGV